MPASDWADLIKAVLAEVWPDLVGGPLWVEAQLNTESAGNPQAKSPVGAVGLLQLMPGTAQEMGLSLEPMDERLDPEKNLRAGIGYLKRQFDHFPEIPGFNDRLYWSFAAYNAGRSYCNAALALARADKDSGWWKWECSRLYLVHRDLVEQFPASQQEQIKAQIAANPRWYRQPFEYVAQIVSYHTLREDA
jgi:membrane-bound lytic murein transglycosylase MltF